MKKTFTEIAKIALQADKYANTINFNGKEYKLTENDIEDDEWWWRGGSVLSDINTYEYVINTYEGRDGELYSDKEELLFFKFGYGWKRETIAGIIIVDSSAYMYVDGKTYRIAYLPSFSKSKLIDDFDYDELRDRLFHGDFIVQNDNGSYTYVNHITYHWPINYFELKFNKSCKDISYEIWGNHEGVVCRTNGKVLARHKFDYI